MATATFRITSRDGEMCLTSASTGESVDFRECNQYDAAQLWERKDYGPLGTAVFQKGRGCLHADCLLDRNEQACASGLEVRFATDCDLTKGVPASLWTVTTDGNMKHAYKGRDYCVHASANEGGKASVRQCPDTGVPEIRFEEGELTQSSLAAANVFMHALRSDATGKCIGSDNCVDADAALSLNPASPNPTILWNPKSNTCFDVDLPSQRGSDGQWRVADGYPKVITGEDPAVRAVGRFKAGACRAKFRFADGRLRATPNEPVATVNNEEFCLDGETMRLVACSTTDAKQGWKTRPTGVAWIDPPGEAAYQAPPPEPGAESPDYYYEESAPAPGPSADGGTLEWLANEKWFWPIAGVIGIVLILAMIATMFYFIR